MTIDPNDVHRFVEAPPAEPTDADKATPPALDSVEGCCASCGAEYVRGSTAWAHYPIRHACAPQYVGTFAASKRVRAQKSQAAEGDPLRFATDAAAIVDTRGVPTDSESLARTRERTLETLAAMRAEGDPPLPGQAGCAGDCRGAYERGLARRAAEGDPLAEMRAYVANAKAAQRPGDVQQYLVAEVAEQMLEIAERTVLPALSLAESERRAATMLADTYQMRAESAEAALTGLVAADATTDAQRLARAWSKAKERVKQ